MNTKYRKTIIAGNWKMNILPSEVRAYADALRPVSSAAKWCETVICAPFVLIPSAIRAFKACRVAVGAQNVSEYREGAYTGEVSAVQLHELGVGWVIIGHSERRRLFGETDDIVNTKVAAALTNSIKPIICVGETARQRELGVTEELVSLQVKAALHDISEKDIKHVCIAYEPLWAIGTGETATPEDAETVISAIRRVVRELYGARAGRGMSILYGGSMNETNAAELLRQPDIDGGLIGGASLDPEKFAAIISAAGAFDSV